MPIWGWLLCRLISVAVADVPRADVNTPWTLAEAGSVTAVVSLGPRTVAVACAADNVLRVYREGRSMPVARLDVGPFLGTERPADIRGGARLGDRVYWIGSQRRDEQGGLRPERRGFFATDRVSGPNGFTLVPAGRPRFDLIRRLPGRNNMATLRLDRALDERPDLPAAERRRLLPTREGAAVGALAADPRVGVLWIGFRNPRPVRVLTGRPHALMVPLNNPDAVLLAGEAPVFGEAMLWDLDGLGITGLAAAGPHGETLVLAQPHDAAQPARLYHWPGAKAYAPEPLRTLDARPGRAVWMSPCAGVTPYHPAVFLGDNAVCRRTWIRP